MPNRHSLPSLEDLDLATLSGVRVLVRVDFNVPLEHGRVADTARLEAAMPTIAELSEAGALLLLTSHCGRPRGEFQSELSLQPVASTLGELLGRRIGFATDCIGEPALEAAASLRPGDICLLENLRFHRGETQNDAAFAAALAELADVYVSDAFGAVHRAHASVVGVPALIARRAAGRLLAREIDALGRLLASPRAPFAAVLGGAKISGKMDTIENLLPRVDTLLVGGAMANTFLAAQGHDLRESLVERERLVMARDLLDRAEAGGVLVVLPTDLVVTDDLDSPSSTTTVPVEEVPAGARAVDIGEDTRCEFTGLLTESGTVFWNGPMGVFERPPFDAGTVAVAGAVADCPGFTVIGGGETVAAARRARAVERIDHVSTGGGASLELLAGKTLPGVAILERSLE